VSAQQIGAIRPVRQDAATQRPVSKPVPVAAPQTTINAFQKDTEAIQNAPDPLLARMTLYVLALFIVAGLTWTTVSVLDKIVVAKGKVASIEPNVMIQPLDMALIKTLNVRQGDVVHKGQILATLDPTFTQADVLQLESRVANGEALLARLRSEQANQAFQPPQDRYGYGRLQYSLWRERQAQYRAQMQSYDEKISRINANISKYEMDRQHLLERLKVVKEIENMRSSLLATQVGSKLNLLQAVSDRIDIERNLVLNQNEMQGNRHDLAAMMADRDVFVQQWNGKIVEEQTTAQNELESLREQLTKARRRQEQVSIESPIDGVVLELSPKAAAGSVAKEAEPLFTLVPLNAELEVEASIEARDLAFVQVGDKVRVKVEAYPYMQHGSLEGEVLTISEDSFAKKDETGAAFYRARIRLLETKLENVPSNFRLIPGMPVDADIKVGERRIITYFLRPILRGVDESLREP